MTAQKNEDDLIQALSAELESLSTENAERLTNILRGLFACMQDLDTRLAELEAKARKSGED
jgi:hypothetical protein